MPQEEAVGQDHHQRLHLVLPPPERFLCLFLQPPTPSHTSFRMFISVLRPITCV